MQTIDQTTAALVALTEAGIPVDVQEILVRGDPARGIAPGAINRALERAGDHAAFIEGIKYAATWHEAEVTRKRSVAVKSKRLEAQIATHEASAAHFRAMARRSDLSIFRTSR